MYTNILNQVCMRGKQELFDLVAACGVVTLSAMLDPRVVYGPADRRMHRIVDKQYKTDVRVLHPSPWNGHVMGAALLIL
jgi:hypothetical protein